MKTSIPQLLHPAFQGQALYSLPPPPQGLLWDGPGKCLKLHFYNALVSGVGELGGVQVGQGEGLCLHLAKSAWR